MAETMTVKLSETKRGKTTSGNANRYATCCCGRRLHIGKATAVERGEITTAYCASEKCGATVRIVKG